MANRLLTIAVLVLALVNVGLFVAVLTRDDGDGSSADRGTIASTTPTPTPTASARGTTASVGSPSPATGAIVLRRSSLVARPFAVVSVRGEWRHPRPDGRRKVHVEALRRGTWSPFPLPAVTDPSGRFTAFVNLGAPGRYRLRVVGAPGGPVSDSFSVTVR